MDNPTTWTLANILNSGLGQHGGGRGGFSQWHVS